MLRLSPISGVIAPYSSAQLRLTFKPFSLDGGGGFRAQPLSPQQQMQPFDGLLQVGAVARMACVSVPPSVAAASLHGPQTCSFTVSTHRCRQRKNALVPAV